MPVPLYVPKTEKQLMTFPNSQFFDGKSLLNAERGMVISMLSLLVWYATISYG